MQSGKKSKNTSNVGNGFQSDRGAQLGFVKIEIDAVWSSDASGVELHGIVEQHDNVSIALRVRSLNGGDVRHSAYAGR